MMVSINLNEASTVQSLNQDSNENSRILIIDERESLPPLRVQRSSIGSNRRIRAFGILKEWKIDAQRVKDELRSIHG